MDLGGTLTAGWPSCGPECNAGPALDGLRGGEYTACARTDERGRREERLDGGACLFDRRQVAGGEEQDCEVGFVPDLLEHRADNLADSGGRIRMS